MCMRVYVLCSDYSVKGKNWESLYHGIDVLGVEVLTKIVSVEIRRSRAMFVASIGNLLGPSVNIFYNVITSLSNIEK